MLVFKLLGATCVSIHVSSRDNSAEVALWVVH